MSTPSIAAVLAAAQSATSAQDTQRQLTVQVAAAGQLAGGTPAAGNGAQ